MKQTKLDSVAEFVENCDARIAITADHGNAMGEWDEWVHPPRMPVPVVRKVLWIIVGGKDRRTRTPDKELASETQGGATPEDTIDQLTALEDVYPHRRTTASGSSRSKKGINVCPECREEAFP